MASSRVPAATYRLQFHHGFRFIAAQALVPYLAALGVSDLYASPLFRARRKSLHGYSVTNPLVINPELGSKVSFNALARTLKSQDMGLVLDIVPNHMALSHDNPWWLDVLENGPASPFAVFFDVDWHPPNKLLEGRVLQPILGAPYNEVLENQEIGLGLDEAGFAVHYYDHKFPLDPKTYHVILTHGLNAFIEKTGRGNLVSSLWGLITLAEHLPPRTVTSRRKLRERNRQKEILKENLWILYRDNPAIKEFIDNNLVLFNGRRGEPDSFNLLDNLLNLQAFRLAHWRVAQDMINYRRFFSINDLIGLRVEDPQVFEASHGLLVNLARDGRITGLRIDHIDGLYDPQEYLERLQATLAQATGAPAGQEDFFVLVEKILETKETLPDTWPVAGTTGYDFLTMVDGLLVDPQGLRHLREIYDRFSGVTVKLLDVVYDKKKLIMASLFGGEVENLGYYLGLLAAQDRPARDISRQDLVRALFELTACLPVYRTYIRSFSLSAQDRKTLDQAFEEVGHRQPDLNPAALEFLRRVLFLETPAILSTEQKNEWLDFVMRWQQFTGPIMAKGLEDTASYIYNPLVSLNEVGSCFEAVSPAAFHEFNQQKRQGWPFTLNATSTHDTKRSEDVRLRLQVLSEIPEEWEASLKLWSAWNQGYKKEVNNLQVPDASEEVLLYQTILGAWPLDPGEFSEFKNRLQEYLIKAAREAKVHTRWISPNLEHEQALTAFLAAILQESADNAFLQDVHEFQARLAFWGALNSLSQVLFKITSPGVPDFYQGTEVWNLSLVDPDNRRPVDFQRRMQLLNHLKKQEKKSDKALIDELRAQWKTGGIKLFVTYKALNFRRAHLDLFLHGDYLPLTAEGERQPHLVAFARRYESLWVLAVAGRFFSRLSPPGQFPLGEAVWGETALALPPEAPTQWRSIFTGDTVTTFTSKNPTLPLKQVFSDLPVALLWGLSD
ncbi:MAG: malto-oligosyltrehalose synthase [Syntrophobacterales bacterium]